MSYCGNCGNKLRKGVQFCSSSGNKIPLQSKTEINERKLNKKEETKQEPIVSFAPGEKIQQTELKPNKRPWLKIMMAISVFLLSLATAFYFIVYPRYFNQVETPKMSISFATGYWVTNNDIKVEDKKKEFDAKKVNKAIYIDEEIIVIAQNGEESLTGYEIEEYKINEKENILKIFAQDMDDEKEKIDMTMSFYKENIEENPVIEIETNEESEQYISITEEEYVQENGLDLRAEYYEREKIDNSKEQIIEDVDKERDTQGNTHIHITSNSLWGDFVGEYRSKMIYDDEEIDTGMTVQSTFTPVDELPSPIFGWDGEEYTKEEVKEKGIIGSTSDYIESTVKENGIGSSSDTLYIKDLQVDTENNIIQYTTVYEFDEEGTLHKIQFLDEDTYVQIENEYGDNSRYINEGEDIPEEDGSIEYMRSHRIK